MVKEVYFLSKIHDRDACLQNLENDCKQEQIQKCQLRIRNRFILFLSHKRSYYIL